MKLDLVLTKPCVKYTSVEETETEKNNPLALLTDI